MAQIDTTPNVVYRGQIIRVQVRHLAVVVVQSVVIISRPTIEVLCTQCRS